MSVEVEVVDQTGLDLAPGAIADLVVAVLEAEGASGSLTVAFVDEQAIRELNARYRGLPESTDVLSFRYADEPAEWAGNPAIELGDVVLCPAVVRRYAIEEAVSVSRQFGWTLIHGVLHLVGYDHEKDHGEMREREQQLLNLFDRFVDHLPSLSPRSRETGR